ncbi:MAG: MFS transporter [Candidatus Bathyarchaeota archaeon]|nr:MAG: MFS transporter [Candidatus Bathyarchaeota archaeon]
MATEEPVTASLEENVKVFAARALLKGTYNQIHRVIYQPFILNLNPSMTVLGLLEGLGGYQGLLGAVIRPFFGWLSDRVQRKPFIDLGSHHTLLSITFFLLAGLTTHFYLVIPAILLMGISLLDMPIVDSLFAESVPPRDRGTIYSRIMMMMMAPGIFAPFIGGFIADQVGFIEVFFIGLVIQFVIFFLIIRYLRENPFPKQDLNVSEFYSFFKRNISPPKNLRNIYLLNMLDAFVVGMGPMLIIGLLRSHFNFSNFQLGIISASWSLITTLAQIFMGRMIKQFGCKNVIIISYLTFVIYLGGIALAKNFLVVLLIHIFWGIAMAAWRPPLQTLMANSTTQAERAEAMGRISFYRGFFGFLSPFLGGILYELYGYSAPLWASFIGGIAVTAFIHFHIRVKDDKLI